jgi:SsrA-binding protein
MPDLAVNRKASHDFEFLQTFEGGLALTGAEVKSIRAGNTNLKGAFITIQKGELYLKHAHVGHYAPAGKQETDESRRDRKILVHKKELGILRGKLEAERLTIVPLSLYTVKSLVKLKFALARGKKSYEKRDALKARDIERDVRRFSEHDA